MPLKHNSPSAKLLRSSRLFAMPAPIKPMAEVNPQEVFGSSRASDTATQYHPTHQAITTPPSSWARGDWGLKRPLPIRTTTRTSNPIMRVQALDTVERVTDFSSAADHALTVKKWHEMGMPISVPRERSGLRDNSGHHMNESAFDFTVDNIHRPLRSKNSKKAEGMRDGAPEKASSGNLDQQYQIDARDMARGRANNYRRWRFKGPWLGGMSNTDFETWLKQKALPRSGPLMKELRTDFRRSIIRARQKDALHDGNSVKQVSREIDDVDIDREIRKLRRGAGNTESELSELIRQRLDLPGFTDAGVTSPRISEAELRQPARTHPSAGLSYLRSHSYLENHPLLGPQADHAPVSARLLQPKGYRRQPMLGVAGVVTNEDGITSAQTPKGRSRAAAVSDFAVLDRRYWVQPKEARIDPKGRVILDVRNPNHHTIAVREGHLGESTVPQQPQSRARGFDPLF